MGFKQTWNSDTIDSMIESIERLEVERDAYFTQMEDFSVQARRLQEECDALAAHVERLHEIIEPFLFLAEDEDIAEARSVMADSPTTSLARLKAQWQAEALEAVAGRIRSDARNAMHGHALHQAASVLDEEAAELRRQAEEAG